MCTDWRESKLKVNLGTGSDPHRVLNIKRKDRRIQSTLVISNSKGLSEILRYPYLDISDLQNRGKNN